MSDAGDFADVGAIETARENGSLKPAERMVVGEILVVEIESTRLERDIDNRTGTTTERFFATLEDEATLSI